MCTASPIVSRIRSIHFARRPITRAPQLLHSHVLAEIIIRPAVTFEAPAYALGLKSAGKDLGQEALLCGPAGLGLRLAVAARHGVVEPPVWCARGEGNIVALAVVLE